MGDENDSSLASAIGLSFAVFGATGLTGRRRFLYALCVPLFLAALISTQSRGGFLAGGAVVVYFLLRQPGLIKKVIFPLIAVAMFLMLAPEGFKREIFSLDEDVQVADEADSTISKRFYLWMAGVNMFLDNPVLGVGAQNYTWHVHEYQPRGGNWPAAFVEQDLTMQVSHSMYVDIISELGLPGAILWLYVVITTAVHLIALTSRAPASDVDDVAAQRIRFDAQALSGAFLAFLVGGVSLAVAYYPYLWYIVGMSTGLLAAASKIQSSASNAEVVGPASHLAAGRRTTAKPRRDGQRWPTSRAS
jgi:O-antigen ligase